MPPPPPQSEYLPDLFRKCGGRAAKGGPPRPEPPPLLTSLLPPFPPSPLVSPAGRGPASCPRRGGVACVFVMSTISSGAQAHTCTRTRTHAHTHTHTHTHPLVLADRRMCVCARSLARENEAFAGSEGPRVCSQRFRLHGAGGARNRAEPGRNRDGSAADTARGAKPGPFFLKEKKKRNNNSLCFSD